MKLKPSRSSRVALFLLLPLGLLAVGNGSDGAEPRRTKNVVIVTLDGFRRQELFTGAEAALCDAQFGGVKDPADLKRRFVRETAEERRMALMPFFWSTLAREGQIFGDASQGAEATITNGQKFSYPGYNELFCGFGDPRIDSNDKKNNPNLSVFEFLNGRPGFQGRVAVFCTWDVFPFIFRSSQNGLPVLAGWQPVRDEPLTERQQFLNAAIDQLPHYWANNIFDWFTMEAAREHHRRHKPRILYVGLGETDEWAHARRYDLYLDAAYRSDRFLAELWRTLQSMDEYRDQTTLFVTTDHGRGPQRENWTDHGKNVPTAEFVWMAVIGPDTPPLGIRKEVKATQSQVAATIAALVGEDFRAAAPQAAPPLPVMSVPK